MSKLEWSSTATQGLHAFLFTISQRQVNPRKSVTRPKPALTASVVRAPSQCSNQAHFVRLHRFMHHDRRSSTPPFFPFLANHATRSLLVVLCRLPMKASRGYVPFHAFDECCSCAKLTNGPAVPRCPTSGQVFLCPMFSVQFSKPSPRHRDAQKKSGSSTFVRSR